MTGLLARSARAGSDPGEVSDQAYYAGWFETVATQAGGFAWGVLLSTAGPSGQAGAGLATVPARRGPVPPTPDASHPAVLCRWPTSASEPLDPRALSLAQEASVDGEGRFEPYADGGAWLLAYPVAVGDRIPAVVLVELSEAQAVNPSRAMNAIQWGSAWIALRMAGAETGPSIADTALATLARLLDSEGARPAGRLLVQEIARLVSAERVSLGLGIGDRLRVQAVSDVSEFNPRMNEVRQIEAAMREAIAEGLPIVRGAGETDTVTGWPAHAELQRSGAGERIETHPLFSGGEPIGALLIEHRAATTPTLGTDAMASVLAIAARALQLQTDAAATIPQRLARTFRSGLTNTFGPEHYRRKTVLAVGVAAVALFSVLQGDYRLGAEAQVEAAFQRVLTAPWNGYLAQASARPGDEVRSGQVLLKLDDREQALEQVRWVTEVEKLRKKIDQATAGRDRPALMVLAAQLRQAEAQLALVERQLSRIEVAAPFDGLIVSGDPTQRLGDVLKKGEVVYQIAPLNAYRLKVRIPETRIADLKVGMPGTMQLSSIPGLALSLRVERIHPFTERRDGQSFFVAEAAIEGDLAQVRPGMEGIATIAIDRRNLFGIWTRRLADWMRVTWWSLFG